MNPEIAYFSAEIGISSSLPTYSGGLGVLAGDHIKASADAGLPMVGVTLMYKEGYFKQHLDSEGIQTESYPSFDLNKDLVKIPEKFTIALRERDVSIQVYRYIYKGENEHLIPIYFLDTDVDENAEDDRIISNRLYSGGKNRRILQEALLGFGGIKLLDILGYKNLHTYHMNEGHCSFLTLALLDKYNGDENKVRSMCHFTTHTPVPAGHDQFSLSRCRNLLFNLLPDQLQLPSWTKKNRLHMTELGLHFSRTANGVSELHGEVAQNQFPSFPIDYITNGIYHPYWLGNTFNDLFNSKIEGWKTKPEKLLDINHITDDELEYAHMAQKSFLLDHVNSLSDIKFSDEIFTIGFARRAAQYKRAGLIFSDIDKLLELGNGKIQIVFAGKAHPKDDLGKEIIREIISVSEKLKDSIKIIFIENYNMKLGRMITSGVDVWLNTPLRPNEASGTSGMKAALNGVPNLSILDGWWAEGCEHGLNGWAIGSPDLFDDSLDAKSLYELLEKEVIPTFYNDKKKWCEMMRCSIATAVSYTAHRMINDYYSKFYKK